MRTVHAFLLGITTTALLGAVVVQESPGRYHGFATVDGEWVVVDAATGNSCRFTNEILPQEWAETVVETINEAKRSGDAENERTFRQVLNRADCRTSR